MTLQAALEPTGQATFTYGSSGWTVTRDGVSLKCEAWHMYSGQTPVPVEIEALWFKDSDKWEPTEYFCQISAKDCKSV